MAFGQHTPESLLHRSDSRNPSTTCRGLTANGRPCRRALAQCARFSPAASPSRGEGLLAVHHNGDGNNPAAFYCWQHKEQAENLAAGDRQTTLMPLKARTSVDTLVDRIGVMNLDEDVQSEAPKHRRRRRKPEQPLKKRDTLPSQWHSMQSPLMTVPEDVLEGHPSRPQKAGRSNVKASFLCCLRADDEDLPYPNRRHDQRSSRPPRPAAGTAYPSHAARPPKDHARPNMIMAQPASSEPIRRKPVLQQESTNLYPTLPAPYPQGQLRPPARLASTLSPNPSQTQSLLSLIPTTLSPATTSLLLAELSKPISSADEAGYIYVFWLTPESEASKPDDDTASSLLDLVSTPDRARRESDALHRYGSTRGPSKRTILLKIGRAANVHRRLSQWTKQCGQNITLVRYYPYLPSIPAVESTSTPYKVPHVHRVERLIHIELAEKRVHSESCDACGREHREWFEVEATRRGLREIDECVRRWVGWSERAT